MLASVFVALLSLLLCGSQVIHFCHICIDFRNSGGGVFTYDYYLFSVVFPFDLLHSCPCRLFQVISLSLF